MIRKKFSGNSRETYDVTIEGIAQKGDGIAKVEGFIIFVPGTKVGDKVTIKVEKVLRNLLRSKGRIGIFNYYLLHYFFLYH